MKLSYRLASLVTACTALLIVVAALRMRPIMNVQSPVRPMRRFGPPPLFTAENKEKVRQQIGITLEQQARIEALYAENDCLRTALRARLSDRMRESRALYNNYAIDTTQETALRQEITKIQDNLFQSRMDTERKLRDILTREQFARLHVLLNQRRERSHHDFRSHRSHSPSPDTF